mmetsp:Transcript_4184/g.14753  ORF Transcript_4184/g.14753 Transcript_4184/m.14753 type:complete len:296 (-) Transcript_4184:329-1216(-)
MSVLCSVAVCSFCSSTSSSSSSSSRRGFFSRGGLASAGVSDCSLLRLIPASAGSSVASAFLASADAVPGTGALSGTCTSASTCLTDRQTEGEFSFSRLDKNCSRRTNWRRVVTVSPGDGSLRENRQSDGLSEELTDIKMSTSPKFAVPIMMKPCCRGTRRSLAGVSCCSRGRAGLSSTTTVIASSCLTEGGSIELRNARAEAASALRLSSDVSSNSMGVGLGITLTSAASWRPRVCSMMYCLMLWTTPKWISRRPLPSSRCAWSISWRTRASVSSSAVSTLRSSSSRRVYVVTCL